MKDNFFELVYTIVAQVPRGRVTTYGAVAKFLNKPRGSRAVGWAMRQCSNEKVPCHRVIYSDGTVGGYGVEGVSRKIALLRTEGIIVSEDRIDLGCYFFSRFTWKPVSFREK
ncbi:MAG: MGMT family protein [Thaumarchaeota archaeon]|nr:MGMT family protein [Nitrososphaerota archaeon]